MIPVPTLTVQEALRAAQQKLAEVATARQDAELLLLRALGRDRAWLLTHSDAILTEEQTAQYASWVDRRTRHEPIQYILGEQEFYGLKLQVTPDVLIPRPETEHLVEALLARAPRNQRVQVADVGTGSGAVAIAAAHALPLAQVTALDFFPRALEVARANAATHHVAGQMRFVRSDLLDAVRGERFFAVVSNPPYVGESEVLEAQVRDYEPHSALFAGPSGLEIYDRLIPQAWSALVPGGWLLMEIGHGQREAIAQRLTGWDEVSFAADLQGIPRVAIGRRSI